MGMTYRSVWLALAVGAALAASWSVAAAATNIVQNGSFETPVESQGVTSYGQSATFDGWTVAFGNVEHIRSDYWQDAEGGAASVDLSGTTCGGIYQDLSTIIGTSYLLSFDMAGNPDAGPTIKTMNVQWNGTIVRTQTFDTSGRSRQNMGWQTFQLTVVAAVSTTRVEFDSVDSPCTSAGPTLDEVSVTTQANAVTPEAPLVVLLVPAAGAVVGGVALVRRRRSAS
jgi:choice-of-anchor C domain-containing protein